MPLTRKRVIDFGIYVLIALALVGAVILYAEIGPFSWMPSLRWWCLAGLTAMLFGYAVRERRRHWRQASFWLNLAWLGALHLTGWGIVLTKAPLWGTLWFVPPIVVEAGLLALVLHKLGYHVSG
jgi:peptidoglycan/LPS O-acetylase OafA/YrhL